MLCFLSVQADGFSAQSVSDAQAVINRIGSAEYPATPEVVTDYLSDLNAALSSPNVALSLAQAYEVSYSPIISSYTVC